MRITNYHSFIQSVSLPLQYTQLTVNEVLLNNSYNTVIAVLTHSPHSSHSSIKKTTTETNPSQSISTPQQYTQVTVNGKSTPQQHTQVTVNGVSTHQLTAHISQSMGKYSTTTQLTDNWVNVPQQHTQVTVNGVNAPQ